MWLIESPTEFSSYERIGHANCSPTWSGCIPATALELGEGLERGLSVDALKLAIKILEEVKEVTA